MILMLGRYAYNKYRLQIFRVGIKQSNADALATQQMANQMSQMLLHSGFGIGPLFSHDSILHAAPQRIHHGKNSIKRLLGTLWPGIVLKNSKHLLRSKF